MIFYYSVVVINQACYDCRGCLRPVRTWLNQLNYVRMVKKYKPTSGRRDVYFTGFQPFLNFFSKIFPKKFAPK